MTPRQFLTEIERKTPGPAYLFLGPETYDRDRCRSALISRMLEPGEVENGLSRHDLEDSTLAAVIDDAASLSLFAPRRVILVGRAEAVVPKGRAAANDPDTAALGAYLKNPSPETVIVFDSSRYEFEGEDKAKVDRLRKLFDSVPVVEFPRYGAQEARQLAQQLATERKLRIGANELSLLVESLGSAASRIASEIEKLSLWVGDRPVTPGDIALMVPQAQSTTIFALVAALGRRDRARALDALDILVREGEYLPLALSFLGTQFRQALAASEAGLRSSRDIMGHFAKLGVPMWPSRAEQVHQTLTAFRPAELRNALGKLAKADFALRDVQPGDRLIMEAFVLSLTN